MSLNLLNIRKRIGMLLTKKTILFILYCSLVLSAGCATMTLGLAVGASAIKNQIEVTKERQKNEMINETIRKAIWNYGHFFYNNTIKLLTNLLEIRTNSEQQIVIHTYLGASFYLQGRVKDAEDNFRKILLIDKNYKLDPKKYPPHMIKFYQKVKRVK